MAKDTFRAVGDGTSKIQSSKGPIAKSTNAIVPSAIPSPNTKSNIDPGTNKVAPAQVSAKKKKSGLEKAVGVLGGIVNSLQPFPNVRLGQGTSNRDRQIMTWRLPNGASIQMYINPQNFEIRDTKQINATRTKGGYIVQYWGQNLTQISIRGTTGSSGVRGINVLYDIYNAENRAFELVAATQTNDLVQALSESSLGEEGFGEITSAFAGIIRDRNFILRPSLASLATSIQLYYQGTQYKGYFTEFTTTESTQNLGLFDYSMTYMATEKRGTRKNFMAWHKEPLADDLAGQLINGVGNAIRRSFGLSEQAPTQFHPENAPYSFGGNSLPGALGFDIEPSKQITNKLIP